MATSKEIANLVINKVESQTVYDYMVDNNLINDDELYFVETTEDTEIVVEDENFIATYGNATFEEIKEAYDAGKVCFCKNESTILPLHYCSSIGATFSGCCYGDNVMYSANRVTMVNGSEVTYDTLWQTDTITPKQMPDVTTADNGKFLRVVDGAWAVVTIVDSEGVEY